MQCQKKKIFLFFVRNFKKKKNKEFIERGFNINCDWRNNSKGVWNSSKKKDSKRKSRKEKEFYNKNKKEKEERNNKKEKDWSKTKDSKMKG